MKDLQRFDLNKIAGLIKMDMTASNLKKKCGFEIKGTKRLFNSNDDIVEEFDEEFDSLTECLLIEGMTVSELFNDLMYDGKEKGKGMFAGYSYYYRTTSHFKCFGIDFKSLFLTIPEAFVKKVTMMPNIEILKFINENIIEKFDSHTKEIQYQFKKTLEDAGISFKTWEPNIAEIVISLYKGHYYSYFIVQLKNDSLNRNRNFLVKPSFEVVELK